jgi:vesicle coat complex subunit
MIKAEKITTQLCGFLSESVSELLILVLEERFEEAAELRDDIETKIMRVHNYLINNNLTKLTPEELTHQLEDLKFQYIRIWEELLDMTGDKAIFNI